MRTNTKISILILLILTIIGCQNSAKKVPMLIKKDFGKWEKENDSLGVELGHAGFDNWIDLLNRTGSIACNDSIPKITLKTDNQIKTVYFRNPCWENFACILIKEKNTIKIHNDSIGKYHEDLYPLDSLTSILRRDIKNNGKNPMLSDSPEKLLIYISYDKNGFENLPNTLNKLTQSYELITNKTDINIWLDEKLDTPPPPPPKELGEI
ncbi:hypothetical protein [Cellulophaga sp. HaHa_2_1]|uniref:hypothetical protein n=1 Tax=Cellulophaga sp. HaHa_2_1 TaxID=2749994 RepID=UPI001C4FA206|nr:hypothetical protein [Cellulophaga sp. HaHa_2_1]QXP52514.1 hypothetical protein H0I24_00895 [Cellulophaga sp. HaHa_2_1]QXP53638.1 hypothetical protein H0I24_06815 [Cellulophaga sp. HaHa_2_1]